MKVYLLLVQKKEEISYHLLFSRQTVYSGRFSNLFYVQFYPFSLALQFTVFTDGDIVVMGEVYACQQKICTIGITILKLAPHAEQLHKRIGTNLF